MNHLKALELFMEADLPGRFVSATRMADVFDWLRTFKGMGDFTAYQLLLNLTYTGLVDFSDADTFVVVGLGARAGLKRCFGPNLSHSQELDIIRWMQFTQKEHFARLGVSCSLGPPRSAHHEMQLCDIEHTLCEIDKVRLPVSPMYQLRLTFYVCSMSAYKAASVTRSEFSNLRVVRRPSTACPPCSRRTMRSDGLSPGLAERKPKQASFIIRFFGRVTWNPLGSLQM